MKAQRLNKQCVLIGYCLCGSCPDCMIAQRPRPGCNCVMCREARVNLRTRSQEGKESM